MVEDKVSDGSVQEGNGILQILEEMEKTSERKRKLAGVVEGPFFSKATFRCVIRIGLDQDPHQTLCSKKYRAR